MFHPLFKFANINYAPADEGSQGNAMAMFYSDEAAQEESGNDVKNDVKDEQSQELQDDTQDKGDEQQKEAQDKSDDKGEGQQDDAPIYVVKIDGKEIEITEEELLNGYQRQADYTRKTQELAEQRKSFEVQKTQELETLKSALAYYALPQVAEPKLEDFHGKPEEFMKAYNSWQQGKARQDQAKQVLEAITVEETQKTLQRETALLMDAIPEWKDESIRQAELSQMVEMATTRYGFTPEELKEATDHRLFVLLRDAARAKSLDLKPVILKRKTDVQTKMEPGQKKPMNTVEVRRKISMDKLKAHGEVSGEDRVNLFYNT